METRKPYPSDVSDEEWAFVAPYLTLMTSEAPQRTHELREVFNGVRWLVRTGAPWRYLPTNFPPSAVIFDGRTLQSTPESGARAGYDGHKRKRGSKTHLAVDTLGNLLALVVTPANEQERAQVAALAQAVQEGTGEHVELAYVDQGYTGQETADAAQAHGIHLEV